MTDEPGLRERKKCETRRRISDVASGLFIARGFDNVTVAEVAAAANVSKMTVFNYFPRKEDLFLDRHRDLLEELRREITRRAPGESVAEAMRRYSHDLLARQHPLSGAIDGIVRFSTVVAGSRALQTRALEQGRETEQTLMDILAAEAVDADDRVRARLIGVLLSATLHAVYRTPIAKLLAGMPGDQVRREQVGVIDAAFDLLEHGIGGYGASSATSNSVSPAEPTGGAR
ncbi:TetR/AcrR family transcriptional regulator [Solihabitans fulvus]|uniref:TetR/AcrR family transcriptional regulator n=1 Tax=Solihabitans fulvus TaxID=1892852 RepID=A0A5B2XF66_9PSEU|nr:TetR/AcrR family transcriptional regulator [Solihabitans fulvus]KAA2261695.1 TetR/AcrR family transcriptional regulator [Solihabitans fulvus]